ncbi:MAG TPA: tetratricopeptide repeat protein [Candidatus Adamsella sp.]|nr:tetratricopeptide repeat protein [Candidatus Adamsella sp.]
MPKHIKELILLDDASKAELDKFISENDTEEDIFNLGIRFFRYGKFDVSLGFFDEVLERNPDNMEALCNVGNVLFAKEEYEEAKKIFKQVVVKDPTVIKANIMLGSIFYKEQKYDEAISYWLIAHSMDVVDCSIIANLCMAYEKKGMNFITNYYYQKYLDYSVYQKTEDYELILYKVRKLNQVADYNFDIGLKYQKAQKFRAAAEAYLKVLEIYPNHLHANLNMGAICYKAGEYKDAAKFWYMAFIIDPKNAENAGNVALAYDKAGEYSYAYCFYKRYLDMKQGEDTFEVLRISQRAEEIKDKTGSANSHITAGDKHLANRNYFDALYEYENAKMISPQNTEIDKKINAMKVSLFPESSVSLKYFEQAEKYYKNKKFEDAAILLRKVIVLEKNNDELQREARTMINLCYKVINYKREHKLHGWN